MYYIVHHAYSNICVLACVCVCAFQSVGLISVSYMIIYLVYLLTGKSVVGDYTRDVEAYRSRDGDDRLNDSTTL